MSASSYKEAKEAFVSGQTGGSVTRINCVCLTALTTYALWTVLSPQLGQRANTTSIRVPTYEFLILVVPLLLSLTSPLASHPLKLNLFLGSLILLSRRSAHAARPPALSPVVPQRTFSPAPGTNKPDAAAATAAPAAATTTRLFLKPFVTVYRAHMMVMTVICILAVDFRVFPREFAKAETWGTSVMDLGVGSFVFGAGMVAALPLLRSLEQPPLWVLVRESIKKSAGVIALGLVRVLMVKGTDYPEHASEYGVHWNFFFTLGIVPVFGTLCDRLARYIDHSWLAIIISIVHQLFLDQSLQYWALTAERTTFLTRNREGIVSLPGYLSIYLLGTATGLYVLPPDPYFFDRLQALRSTSTTQSAEKQRVKELKMAKAWKSKPGKLASVLGSYAALWWGLYAILKLTGWVVSRRLANLAYVVWVAAFNASFLFGYLVVNMWASDPSSSSTSDLRANPSAPPSPSNSAPAIFDAINRNSLVVFLVANLLTGLVNVSMESMYASDLVAMLVLGTYCAACVAVAWALRKKRLRV
ncbi:hypothetical protein RQP46_001988 [Phenoliferia psychrophenolica]